MNPLGPDTRRRALLLSMVWASVPDAGAASMMELHTFGDSILDCGHYNEHGVHPGQLLVRNDDALFPEFRGQDLHSIRPARLAHHAVDGATVDDLPSQARGLRVGSGPAIAMLTIGGNDLLRGLAADEGKGVELFAARLEAFLRALRIRTVLIGNVYDPTFGDDTRNFLGIAPTIARRNLQRVNDALAAAARRHGRLVDLHAHFLRGDAAWFTRTVEPGLRGASEVRRAFWPALRELARG